MIKFFEKHYKISWFFVILIAITIFYVSSLPFEELAPLVGFSWQTTAYHIIVFFFLAFFLLPALVKGKKKRFIFLSIILAVVYGITDEIHQLFVPGRQFSIYDMMINSAGILAASFFYTLSLKNRKSKNRCL